MPSLVNSETNQIEEIPQDALPQALTSGKYNLNQSDVINLIDPTGKLVGVPAPHVSDAVSKAQFSFPTQADLDKFNVKETYGDKEGLAGVAGALRGTTAGLSDLLISKEMHTPPGAPTPGQILSGLQQANPDVSLGSELTGGIASTLLVPGSPAGMIAKGGSTLTKELLEPAAAQVAKAAITPETSAIAAKIIKGTTGAGAKTLGSAVEAVPWGIGQTISEDSLGNADFNAENLMHNVGYASLFGAGAGLGGHLIGSTYKGLTGKGAETAKTIENASVRHQIIEDAALASERPTTSPLSLDEIAQRNKSGSELGLESEMPAKSRIVETNDILAGDSNFPAHGLQINSFENPTERLRYKMLLKSDTPEAKQLLAYEAHQKAEGVNKLLPKYIQEIAPEAKLTENAIEGGERAVKSFVDGYEAVKKAEAPNFERLDKFKTNAVTSSDDLLKRVYAELPGSKELITVKPSGAFELRPYDATTGVAEGTYKQLRNVVRALNKDDLTIGGIRNLRDVMGDKIDWLKSPKEAAQLTALRRNLMDYMQEELNKATNDINVREVMKRYAINEQNREAMEKIFGGSISDKAKFGKGIEPEKILDRLFSSRENIEAAKGILGPKFNEISANYLSHIVNNAKDSIKGFNSNKVARTLINKQDILSSAFAEKPEQFQKINAIVDKLRGLPDSPPGNPSDTASATELLKNVQSIASLLKNPSQLVGKAMDVIASKIDAGARKASLDRVLSGQSSLDLAHKQQMYTAFSKIERMKNATLNTIDRGVNSLFELGKASKNPTIVHLTPEKYDKIEKKIMKLAQDPEHFIEMINKNTEALANIAPNTMGSLHTNAANATQFLASKLPVRELASPFAEPHKPSSSEIAKFNRYYQVVRDPFLIMHQIKTGTLTPESLETIKTVYPQLYGQMNNAIMDKLTPETVKELPYSTKLMLTMFTGVELTKSLKASNIQSAQAAIMGQKAQGQQQGKSAYNAISQSNRLLTDTQRVESRKR